MPSLDRHIAISSGWIAGPAAGVALMGAPAALGIASQTASGICFYAGASVFALTILAVVVHSLRERGRRHDKMWPILLMSVGAALLLVGAAAYFWPRTPITPSYQGEITGVAAFDVSGQPGLLNVIPVVTVRNLKGEEAGYIANFALKIHFATGTEKEAEAEPVFDEQIFRGPNGATDINPQNTLWGRDGAPPITRFRSGRLWFPFNGDLAEFINLDTRLTLMIKDSSGTTSTSTVRLGDIGGPRISSQPFTGPPAAPLPSPAQPK